MDKLKRRRLGREIVRDCNVSGFAAYLKDADAKELAAAWKFFISSIAVEDTVDTYARGWDNLPIPGMCDAEKMMLLFIQAGADINFNYNYATPIMKCAGFGWMVALDELVARGANPGTVQVGSGIAKKRGQVTTVTCGSPMHRAAQGGHIPIMERLLSLGATLDDGDHSDQSPLWRATSGKKLEAMEWLVDRGADVKRICHGQNLLHALVNTVHLDYSEAELQGAVERARWLIERGVDPTLKDDWGHAPIFIAGRSGRDEIGQAMKAAYEKRALGLEIGTSPNRRTPRI